MPPVPKKRHSKGRTGRRRNAPAHRRGLPSLIKCPSCKELKLPHTACPHCGFYNK